MVVNGHSSCVARGNRGNVPPQRLKKIVWKKWYYLSAVYCFGEEVEIIEKFRGNLWKSQFSIKIMIKKSESFRKISKDGLFRSKPARLFTQLFEFSCQIELIHQLLLSFIFTKISRICIRLPITRSKTFLNFLRRFLK